MAGGKAQLRVDAKARATGFLPFGKAFRGAVGAAVLLNQTLGILSRVAGMATTVIKGTVGALAEFESGMAQVKTLLDTGEKSFAALNESILDLAKQSSKSIDDLTKSMYDLRSAGVETADMLRVLDLAQRGAIAGATETKNVVNAVMATINAYSLSISKVQAVLDLEFMTVKLGVLTYEELAGAIGKILPVAKLAGESLYTVHAALAVVTKGGFTADEAATALSRAFSELTKSSKLENFKKIGIITHDASGKFRGMRDIVDQISKKIAGMSNEQKVFWLSQLGLQERSARAFLTLIEKSKLFDETVKKMRTSAGSTQEAYEDMYGTIKENWGRLTTTLKTEIIKWMSDHAEGINDIIDDWRVYAENFGLILDVVLAAWRLFVDSCKQVWTTMIGVLETGLLGLAGIIRLITGDLIFTSGELEGIAESINENYSELEGKVDDTISSFWKLNEAGLKLKKAMAATRKEMEKAKFPPETPETLDKMVDKMKEGQTSLIWMSTLLTDINALVSNYNFQIATGQQTLQEQQESWQFIIDNITKMLTHLDDYVFTQEELVALKNLLNMAEINLYNTTLAMNKPAKANLKFARMFVSTLTNGIGHANKFNKMLEDMLVTMIKMVAQAALLALIFPGGAAGAAAGSFGKAFFSFLSQGGTANTLQQYEPMYAQAGAFRPRGTDTVPSMYTKGEYVEPAAVVPGNFDVLESIRLGTKEPKGGDFVVNVEGNLVGNDDFLDRLDEWWNERHLER